MIDINNMNEQTLEDLATVALTFISELTTIVGEDKAQALYDTVCDALGSDFKNNVTMQLLRNGGYASVTKLTINPPSVENRNMLVSMIKAVRVVTGYGLKEAKDAVDRIHSGLPTSIQLNPGAKRYAVINELVAAGFSRNQF